jgi:RND family efflux transporter MFP subunit
MSKKLLFMSVIILVTVIGLLVILEDEVVIEKKEQKNFYPKVSVNEVNISTNQALINGYAQIKPRWKVNLKALIDGDVIKFNENALEGKKVNKGDLLIQIDPSVYENKLNEARLSLEEAKLELLEEKQKHNNYLNNWKRSGIKEKPSNLALNLPQIQIAKRKIEVAKSMIKQAKKQVNDTKVIAPFSGFIINRSVNIAQKLNVGDDLFELIDDSKLDITLMLDVNEWKLLHKKEKNKKVKIFNEDNVQIASGTITHISEYLDEETRQYKLFITIDNLKESTILGTFVRVAINGNNVENTLKILESSYTRNGLVWYIDENDTLRSFEADLLFTLGKYIVIKTPKVLKNQSNIKIAINPLLSFIDGKKVLPVKVK